MKGLVNKCDHNTLYACVNSQTINKYIDFQKETQGEPSMLENVGYR